MFAENTDFFDVPPSFFIDAPAAENTPAARTSGFSFNLRSTAALLCVAASFFIATTTPQVSAQRASRAPTPCVAPVHDSPKVPLRLVRDARLLDRFSHEVEVDRLPDPDYDL